MILMALGAAVVVGDKLLSALFGKAEPFKFTGSTLPPGEPQ